MDEYLGEIMDALGNTGLDEITVLGLGSDHGMQSLLPDGVPAPNITHIIDLRYILQEAGFSVASWRASGPRMANVYLTDPSQATAATAVLAVIPVPRRSGGTASRRETPDPRSARPSGRRPFGPAVHPGGPAAPHPHRFCAGSGGRPPS